MSQPKPTKWWKVFIFAFLGMNLLFGATLLLLPRQFYVSRSLVVEAEQAKVYETAANLRTWPEWAVWVAPDREKGKAPEVHFGEKTRGLGAQLVIEGPQFGSGLFRVVEDDPPTQLTLEAWIGQEDRDQPEQLAGRHRMQLSEEPEGTRIVWSVLGEVGEGWLAPLSVGPRERVMVQDVDASLTALKECLEAGGCAAAP